MHNIKHITILALLATATPALAYGQTGSEGRPGWLGIRCSAVIENQNGHVKVSFDVDSVLSGSPAARGGLQSGDRIVSINNKTLPAGNCSVIGGQFKAGETVRLKLRRGDDTREYTIVADPRPPEY